MFFVGYLWIVEVVEFVKWGFVKCGFVKLVCYRIICVDFKGCEIMFKINI